MFATLLTDTIQKSSAKKNSLPNLGAIVTFLQWMQRKKSVIVQYKEASHTVWENVAELLNLISELRVQQLTEEKFLPEDIELMGFLPLQKQEMIIKSDAPIASADQILNKRIIVLKELAVDFVNDDSIGTQHVNQKKNLN
jgi:hypothetical protein